MKPASYTLVVVPMRHVMVLVLLLGCDALEPSWSEPIGISEANPWPDATCDDVCGLKRDVYDEPNLCLENSCGGTTIMSLDPLGVPIEAVEASCEDPVWSHFSDDPSWQGFVVCCCGSN